jgi:hypothetical protein
MALKPGGKDERLRRTDFVALATLAGLRAGDAQISSEDVLQSLLRALDTSRWTSWRAWPRCARRIVRCV